jgi:hypothetical protein
MNPFLSAVTLSASMILVAPVCPGVNLCTPLDTSRLSVKEPLFRIVKEQYALITALDIEELFTPICAVTTGLVSL